MDNVGMFEGKFANVETGSFSHVCVDAFSKVNIGDFGTVVAGNYCNIKAGYGCNITAGIESAVSVGNDSIIKIAYLDNKNKVREAIGYVEKSGLKAYVRYRLNEKGRFVEAGEEFNLE